MGTAYGYRTLLEMNILQLIGGGCVADASRAVPVQGGGVHVQRADVWNRPFLKQLTEMSPAAMHLLGLRPATAS
jgi:hypothetical protein